MRVLTVWLTFWVIPPLRTWYVILLTEIILLEQRSRFFSTLNTIGEFLACWSDKLLSRNRWHWDAGRVVYCSRAQKFWLQSWRSHKSEGRVRGRQIREVCFGVGQVKDVVKTEEDEWRWRVNMSKSKCRSSLLSFGIPVWQDWMLIDVSFDEFGKERTVHSIGHSCSDDLELELRYDTRTCGRDTWEQIRNAE